jgi:uncharacterized damage-inducible protein DinB
VEKREVLSLEPIADDPEVGRWLSAMEDSRRDTVKVLEGVSDDMVDRRPPGSDNSIGSILYHVALVEADWLLADIFGAVDAPSEEPELLPFASRDEAGQLTNVEGESLGQHLDRLEAVRAIFMRRLTPMPSSDFHRLRQRETFDVSPAWVVHHLLQHEAEHRSEIDRLKHDLSPSEVE